VRRALILAVAIAALLPAAAHAATDPFAEGCPAETLEERASAGLNHNPAAKKAIVPAGATSLRICRYWGFGNESGKQTPATQARVGTLNDQAEVHNVPLLEGLTDEFKELEAAPKGPINCPEDDGSELYAIFFYAHAEPVILHVALSGCRFVSGATPRARDMTASLERTLVRLAKGEHMKAAPKHGEVTEKGVAEYPPPRITVAVAKRGTKEVVEEACAEGNLCESSAWRPGSCTRKSSKLVFCRFTVVLHAGETCHGRVTVAAMREGLISETPWSSGEGSCEYLFVPPVLRHQLEEEGAHEEGKRSSRATGHSPKRT
jgi:hypothetical protein